MEDPERGVVRREVAIDVFIVFFLFAGNTTQLVNYCLYFWCGYLVSAAASEKLDLYIYTLHFSATTFGFYMLAKPRGKIYLSTLPFF